MKKLLLMIIAVCSSNNLHAREYYEDYELKKIKVPLLEGKTLYDVIGKVAYKAENGLTQSFKEFLAKQGWDRPATLQEGDVVLVYTDEGVGGASWFGKNPKSMVYGIIYQVNYRRIKKYEFEAPESYTAQVSAPGTREVVSVLVGPLEIFFTPHQWGQLETESFKEIEKKVSKYMEPKE